MVAMFDSPRSTHQMLSDVRTLIYRLALT